MKLKHLLLTSGLLLTSSLSAADFHQYESDGEYNNAYWEAVGSAADDAVDREAAEEDRRTREAENQWSDNLKKARREAEEALDPEIVTAKAALCAATQEKIQAKTQLFSLPSNGQNQAEASELYAKAINREVAAKMALKNLRARRAEDL
jgi:hypothetical protein